MTWSFVNIVEQKFGPVQRRTKDDATRKDIADEMTVDGKRNRARPKLRWQDLVKDDMARNHMTTEMAQDRRHGHEDTGMS